jgi:Prokaryotic RING finger family 1
MSGRGWPGIPLATGEADAGRSCPYCRFPLKQGAEGVACAACGAVHHADCWQDNGGCAIMGCAGAGEESASPGAPNQPATMKMPAVGLRQPAAVPPPPAGAPTARAGASPGRSALWLAAGLAAVAVVAVALAVGLLLGRREAGRATASGVIASPSRAETPRTPPASGGQTTGAAGSSASPGTGSAYSGQGDTATSGSAASEGSGGNGSAGSSASLTSYSGQGFAVGYPQGWNTVEDQVREQGYAESKWISPTDPSVHLLIDDTPGYSGTAEGGADSVRRQVEQDSSYRQLSWAPQNYPAGRGWGWQFTDRGDERVDTFFVACGTGYAVLGSAPANEFSQYEQLFSQVTSSFAPSC